MALLRQLYAGLRLRVNETKSAVGLAWNRKILSYTFWVNREGTVKRAVADKALATMKDKVRDITKRTGGQSIVQVCNRQGWGNICVVGRNTSGSPTHLASSATWTNGFAVTFGLST